MKFDESRWLRRLLLSSVPLRKVDERRMPIGIASGCLVDYLGKRILLSVSHATKKAGNWVIELKYEPGKGTQIYQVGNFNFLAEIKVGSNSVSDIDFSYSEVASDLKSFYQEVAVNGSISESVEREVFSQGLFSDPSPGELYGFSGQVLPEMHGDHALATEMRVYPGLKYVATEGGYHVFALPVKHPGHDHFYGCSGAPIIDTKGNVVALVCGGDEKRDTIFGVSLKKYKVALDITYWKFSGV